MLRGVEQNRNVLDEGIAAGQRTVQGIYEASRLSILGTLAACALLSILVTILISRAVVRPLERVMGFVERVGSGDSLGRAAGPRQRRDRPPQPDAQPDGGGLAELARTNRARPPT